MANKTAKGLTFIFGADMKGFERAMKKSQRNIKKFGTDMKRMGRSLTMNLTLPMAAFAAASVKAFDTQIKAETKLLTALKGKEDVQKRLIEQAKQLQTITLFGDEETIAAQAMLATMGLEEEAIRRLIPLVQDMAVAKGMNLVQAADLVAKSVGSSTNALSRYGIVIEGAVGSSERLDSAVGALTTMFQGQAEAIAKEGLGPLKQLQNALGDVSEDFGKLIIEGIEPLKNELEKMVGFLSKLTDAQKENIIKWGALAAALGPVVIILSNVVLLFGRLVGFLTSTVKIVGKLAKSTGWGKLLGVVTAVGAGIWQMVTGVRELTELEKNLAKGPKDPLLANILEHGKLVAPDAGGKTPSANGDGMDMTPIPIPDIIPIKELNNELAEIPEKVEQIDFEFKKLGNTFSGEINILAQEFSRMFEFSLSSAMMAQENFFDSFIANIKRAITQMIALQAAQFITNQLFGNLTGATTGANIFTTIFGFANGGLVSGPTLSMVGEGSGTSLSNPEVIAPLDKLKQYMGGGSQNITVTGRLVGNDIWLSNSKTNIQRQRAV
tara:strand:+ start:531 stop:2186 length:1656 start_codon:yes stop_codon:yes gene_type:complete